METQWKEFGDCPKCGGSAEVFTRSKKAYWVYDGEDARCTECDNKGYVNVEDSECADIIWNDDVFEPIL